eukprot:7803875-Pyramimonas_sp.AAC.1
MATGFSTITPRNLNAFAARFFPMAFPVRSSCTSGSTAPAPTKATLLLALMERIVSTHGMDGDLVVGVHRKLPQRPRCR